MRFFYFLGVFALLSCGDKTPEPIDLRHSIVVANGGENSLSILDPTALSERQRLYLKAPQATYLHHLDLRKDGQKLALAFPEYDFSGGHDGLHNLEVSGYVSLFDLATQNIERTIKVPFANHNAIYSPDGKEVWTGLVSHSGRILVHSADTGELLSTITVGADPHEIVFAGEGKYVVVTCMESSFLTVIDAATKKVLREIKVDPFPSNVWKGKDEYAVIVENSNQKTLNFVDLKALSVVDHLDLDFAPGFSGFDADGKLWICAKGQDLLYRYTLLMGKWTQDLVLPTENDPHAFYFLNDQVWLVHQKQNTVAVLDRASGTKLKTIAVGLKPNAILYLPE